MENKDQKAEASQVKIEAVGEGTPNAPQQVEPSQNDTTENGTAEIKVPKTGTESSENKSQPSQNDTSKETQRNIAAEEGKNQQLERERNQYSKEAADLRRTNEQLVKFRDTVDKIYANRPEAYEEFRREWVAAGNTDLGSYEAVYRRNNQNGYEGQLASGQPTSGYPGVNQQISPENVKQIARDAYYEEKVFDAFGQFVDSKDDINPRKVDPSSPEYDARVRNVNTLSRMAAVFQESDPTLTVNDALERAYRSLNAEKQLEEERRTGITIGKAQAAANNVGSMGSISGGTSKETDYETYRLTSEQRARYDELKQRKGEKFANTFAKNAHNENLRK